MENSRLKIIALFSLTLLLLLTGCAPSQKTVEQISEHYKQNHDYESLVALLPYLNFTMSRSDVENLLGEPTMCPISCYYLSGKSVIVNCPDGVKVTDKTCHTWPLVLVVRYDLSEMQKEPLP